MEDRVKKGVVIGLVVVAALIGFLATHKAPRHAPPEGTETAAQLSAEAKPEAAPATTETTPAAPAKMAETAAETPAETPATAAPETAKTEAPQTEAPQAEAPKAEVPKAATPDTAAAKPGEVDVEAAMSDRVLGSDSAPVTVIEYASLTCPHCAHFAGDILPVVKAKLIDTGKMRLIYRDFPLDGMAMKAAQMARCAPKDKYFDLIEVIFKNRDRWITAATPEKSLMQFGALAGMTDERMRSCMNSAALENAITKGVQDAQGKFFIKATPTFIFDYGTETLSGAQDEPKFEEIVNRLTADKPK